MIVGDLLVEDDMSDDFLSKIFGEGQGSTLTEKSENIENSLESEKFKKPAFNVVRPWNTFISIDQALEYSGDNSTYSKRCLYILMTTW